MKTIFSTLTIAIALTLGLSALPAGATTLTLGGMNAVDGSGLTTSVKNASVETFNTGLLPGNYSVKGSGSIVQYNSPGQFAAPANDTTKYLNTGIGSVTATFAGGINYLGFEWSTVDRYNYVDLTSTTGVTEEFSGASIVPANPSNGTTTSYVNFYANPGVLWNSVKFSSTQNSFEIDNVATATPEPGSLAMLASGFVALGIGALRRRKTAAARA